jgi:tetratricopeptide (TPR) repeat protein
VDPGLAQPVTVWTYLLNQSTMIVRYLQAAAWPHNLVFDYGLPQAIAFGRAAPYFAVCVALLAATVIGLVRWPRVGFLGAWFFLTLAPTSSIVPIATEVGAERRMYLPLMAIAVFAVAALDRFRSWLAASTGRRAADALALIAVGVTCATLVVLTIRRNAEYRTAQSIWQTVVDRRPHGRARYNLAMALTASGQRADAIAQLREAVRDYPEAHYGLGAELVADGRSDEAIPHFERFIEARPSHIAVVAAWTDLGIAYATRNDMPRAVRAFEQVVAMTPRNPNARRNLANALLETRDFTGAIAQAREALALNANDTVSRDILEMAVAGTRGAAARR